MRHSCTHGTAAGKQRKNSVIALSMIGASRVASTASGVVEAGGDVLAGIINPKNQQEKRLGEAARAQWRGYRGRCQGEEPTFAALRQRMHAARTRCSAFTIAGRTWHTTISSKSISAAGPLDPLASWDAGGSK